MTLQVSGAGLATGTPPCTGRPLLVAVIGPPGAGKSTIVAGLAAGGGVPVFRLRETIRQRPELVTGFAPSTDPLGWISLPAVGAVLHTIFVDERFGLGAHMVLLDNFPGTAQQLELLAEAAAARGAQLAILEIRATVQSVVTRVAQRRVCLNCGPDTHKPAVPVPGDIEWCSACGEALTRRDTDVPRLHGLRLDRYTASLPDIAQTAAQQGITHLHVDAGAPLREVLASAHEALAQLAAAPHL